MTERKISSLGESESLWLVETDANGYVNTLPSWYFEITVGILGCPPLSGQRLIDLVMKR